MSINIANGTGAEVRAAINETFNLVSSPGFIIFLAAATIPNGWLECDGAAVSRATYADLFAAIGVTFGTGDGSTTFNIPDLRGQFIRVYDHGAGIDPDRVFGSEQTDALQGHYHAVHYDTNEGSGNAFPLWSASAVTGRGSADGYLEEQHIGYPITDGTNGTPRIASETRPQNVALIACIKY
jgi:phage-related tail fiber protein